MMKTEKEKPTAVLTTTETDSVQLTSVT